MAFEIEFSDDAERQWQQLSARDRRTILDAIETQLRHEPARATRNRKPLRQNQVAGWELRIGIFRVLYDIMEDEAIVAIALIAKKLGNKYFVEGQEFTL